MTNIMAAEFWEADDVTVQFRIQPSVHGGLESGSGAQKGCAFSPLGSTTKT